MLKLVHLSDLHLVPPGNELHGLRPEAQLQRAVSHIVREHGDADLCVVSGDLAHDGHPLAYAEVARQLARLPMPVHLMIGNHDDRAAFAQAFPEAPSTPDGFVQQAIDTSVGRIILLDTHQSGAAEGHLCAARLAWLAERIEESGPVPVYLFVHHPPFPVGLKRMDDIRLADDEALWAVLAASRARLRHLFVGHLHRAISGSWCGLPFSGVRGTSHQIALDFETAGFAPVSFEPPGYGVVLIDEDTVVVHFADIPDGG